MQANHEKYVEQVKHVDSFYLSLIHKISFKNSFKLRTEESEAWDCIPLLRVDDLGVRRSPSHTHTLILLPVIC